MNVGIIMTRSAIAIDEPIRVSFIASWPSPFIRNLCPGKTPSAVSSSGAPRNIDGMKSRKVWVIAMLAINAIRVVVDVLGKKGIRERSVTATRLVWIPGMTPVIVPAATPRRMASAISMIIKLYVRADLLVFVWSGAGS